MAKEQKAPPPSDHGVIVTVMHPDFIDNDDQQREGCLEGMQKGYYYIQQVTGLESPFPDSKIDKHGVHLWLPYSDGGPKMAERLAAGFMMSMGRAGVVMNSDRKKEAFPMYDITLKRGPKWPE